MTIVLWLFAVQGALGAFDTLYYHEYRARLPALGARARPELVLHAARDLIYALLFATLPCVAWRGAWAGVLVLLLVAEIAITLADFMIEDRVRRPIGGVAPGERATHALMGIVYGAMLACLVPVLVEWWRSPTTLAVEPSIVPDFLSWALRAMALGVIVSGARDIYASFELPRGAFPWRTYPAKPG